MAEMIETRCQDSSAAEVESKDSEVRRAMYSLISYTTHNHHGSSQAISRRRQSFPEVVLLESVAF